MIISNKLFPYIKWGGVIIASVIIGLTLSWNDSIAEPRNKYNLEFHCVGNVQYVVTKHSRFQDAGGGVAPVLGTNGMPRPC